MAFYFLIVCAGVLVVVIGAGIWNPRVAAEVQGKGHSSTDVYVRILEQAVREASLVGSCEEERETYRNATMKWTTSQGVRLNDLINGIVQTARTHELLPKGQLMKLAPLTAGVKFRLEKHWDEPKVAVWMEKFQVMLDERILEQFCEAGEVERFSRKVDELVMFLRRVLD